MYLLLTFPTQPISHVVYLGVRSAIGGRPSGAGLDPAIGDARTVAPPAVALKLIGWICRGKGRSLHNSNKMEYLARLMYSTGAQVTFVSEIRSSKCTSTQLNARFITSASFVVPSNGLSGGLWLLWSQDVYLSIKFSNSNIILALAVHIPESPNGGRAPWSSVSKKNLNPQIFVSKNSAKNQSCRKYIDPPL